MQVTLSPSIISITHLSLIISLALVAKYMISWRHVTGVIPTGESKPRRGGFEHAKLCSVAAESAHTRFINTQHTLALHPSIHPLSDLSACCPYIRKMRYSFSDFKFIMVVLVAIRTCVSRLWSFLFSGVIGKVSRRFEIMVSNLVKADFWVEFGDVCTLYLQRGEWEVFPWMNGSVIKLFIYKDEICF